jgi:hypothetical protein
MNILQQKNIDILDTSKENSLNYLQKTFHLTSAEASKYYEEFQQEYIRLFNHFSNQKTKIFDYSINSLSSSQEDNLSDNVSHQKDETLDYSLSSKDYSSNHTSEKQSESSISPLDVYLQQNKHLTLEEPKLLAKQYFTSQIFTNLHVLDVLDETKITPIDLAKLNAPITNFTKKIESMRAAILGESKETTKKNQNNI